MSKAQKTCTFVMKRGARAGEKCGKPCRDSRRCKLHNENRLAYAKKYNTARNSESKNATLEKKLKAVETGDKTVKIVEVKRLRKECTDMNREILELTGKIYGYKKRINPDIKPFYKKSRILNGKNVGETLILINKEIEKKGYKYDVMINDLIIKHFGFGYCERDILNMYEIFEGSVEEANKKLSKDQAKLDDLRVKYTKKLRLLKKYEEIQSKKSRRKMSKSSEEDLPTHKPSSAKKSIPKKISTSTTLDDDDWDKDIVLPTDSYGPIDNNIYVEV